MPPPNISTWFQTRVIKPRLLAAYIWATLLSPFFGSLVLVLLGTSPFALFSFTSYRHLFWVATSASLMSYLSLYHIQVTPQVHSNRITVVLAFLSPTLVTCIFLQTLLGAIITNSLVSIALPSYDSLVYQTDILLQDSVKLNEGAFFVGAAGAFAAAIAVFKDVVYNKNVILFPPLNFSKVERVRKSLYELAVKAVHEASSVVKWFFVTYFVFGNLIKNWACVALMSRSTCPESEMVLMNSLFGLLEFSALWSTFVCVFFLLFTLELNKVIVKTYMVQPLSFPLMAAIDSPDADPTLDAALKASEVPQAQHLAFLELYSLAKGNSKDRKPFFCLSQPGGHPHCWNNVSTACMNHLSQLMDQIVLCNSAASLGANTSKPLASTMSASSGAAGLIMRLSPVRFLMMEFPGVKAKKVFIEGQKSVWAVESLSFLIAASFDEDDFGVVQKKLPALLNLIIGLYDAIEKNAKLYPNATFPSGRGGGKGGDDVLSTLRPALRSTLKFAIYRIVKTFGTHLFGIQGLSNETTKKLKNFVELKE